MTKLDLIHQSFSHHLSVTIALIQHIAIQVSRKQNTTALFQVTSTISIQTPLTIKSQTRCFFQKSLKLINWPISMVLEHKHFPFAFPHNHPTVDKKANSNENTNLSTLTPFIDQYQPKSYKPRIEGSPIFNLQYSIHQNTD